MNQLNKTIAVSGLCLLGACADTDRRVALAPDGLEAEFVFSSVLRDKPATGSQLRVADISGRLNYEVFDKLGVELDCRMSPDGLQVAFARERIAGNPQSREIVISWIDRSQDEERYQSDNDIDDAPCWSPDGEQLLFSSDRGGSGRRLWLLDIETRMMTLFHDDSSEQDSPDWSATNDRIVFSRQAAGQSASRLYTIDSLGRVPLQLTDAGSGLGDIDPAWSPDGSQVLFVRQITQSEHALMLVDVASGELSTLASADGLRHHPRWSPQGDRIFWIGSSPDQGVTDDRLWVARPDGSEPRQILMHARFDYPGFDPMPSMAPAPDGETEWIDADPLSGLVEIAAGSHNQGEGDNLRAVDGRVLGIATEMLPEYEIAGLNLRFPLWVDNPDDIVAIEVEAVAALTNPDAESRLSMAVHDATNRRNDVVVELEAGDEEFRTLRCSFSSLAHIDQAHALRIELIGTKQAGDQGELQLDLVKVRVLRRVQVP